VRNLSRVGALAWLVLLVIFHVATLGYFVPSWVALRRDVPHKGSVVVIDIFLGWTLAGWVVALAMACRSKRQPAEIYYLPDSPPPVWPYVGPGGPAAPAVGLAGTSDSQQRAAQLRPEVPSSYQALD
jgi:hypothetical protein